MKNLEISQTTTLKAPNLIGECLLKRQTGFCCQCTEYVSFQKLQKWVASIQTQIIKSSIEQAKDCINPKCLSEPGMACCTYCTRYTPPVG